MNKLTKKECVIIAVVCFFLAVFTVFFSTIRISDLRTQNMSNISWGLNFLNRANDDMVFTSDKIEASMVLTEMESINNKVTFYTWFRIIGGILFAAVGVYFAVSAKKKGDEQTKLADINPTDNE